jgi:hypothetical protein
MKRPNLFIVGAPRCGTTAMYQFLGQHPECYMSPKKEPYFFGSDLEWRKRRIDRERYLALFSGAQDQKILGECSVLYLYSRLAASEIKAFSPDAYIIIMLRDPVEMIYSWHSLLLFAGDEDIEDFGAALDAEADRKRGLRIPRTPMTDNLFYREIGKYYEQVKRYLDTFGGERVHVVIYDDFQRDNAEAFVKTAQFLEIDDDFKPDFRVVNHNHRRLSRGLAGLMRYRSLGWKPLKIAINRMNTKYEARPPMDPELRKQLQAEFAPDVERLSELLGRDLTHWSRQKELVR